jgi:hypothetical protein
MFWTNCRAIFRLICRQVECTVDNAFNLRDLILQELVKRIVVCYIFGPKHEARIIYLILAYIQHKRDVSLEKLSL